MRFPPWLLPSPWVVLAYVPLLVGAVARAQPAPVASQERQVIITRQVVIPSEATGPLPVARVAPGFRTTLFLDAPITPDSVKVEGEGTRVRLVDVGKTSVTVEALTELGTERLMVRADYADGMAPRVFTLALVSDAAQVDAQVRVARRPQSFEAVEAELAATRARCLLQGAELAALKARCEASGPAGLILADLLGKGISTTRVAVPNNTVGLVSPADDDVAHRAAQWAAVAVTLKNLPGQPPWRPGKAQLVSTRTGTPVAALVEMRVPQLAPGESGRVVLETGPLPCELGTQFRVDLWDADGGRNLSIPKVTLEPPKGGGCKDTPP